MCAHVVAMRRGGGGGSTRGRVPDGEHRCGGVEGSRVWRMLGEEGGCSGLVQ
jgi:hypothetical protein